MAVLAVWGGRWRSEPVSGGRSWPPEPVWNRTPLAHTGCWRIPASTVSCFGPDCYGHDGSGAPLFLGPGLASERRVPGPGM